MANGLIQRTYSKAPVANTACDAKARIDETIYDDAARYVIILCARDPPHPRSHWSTASAAQVCSRLLRLLSGVIVCPGRTVSGRPCD